MEETGIASSSFFSFGNCCYSFFLNLVNLGIEMVERVRTGLNRGESLARGGVKGHIPGNRR